MHRLPVSRFITKALDIALDAIAPQDPHIRTIELLEPREFISRAQEPAVLRDLPGIDPLFSYKNSLVKDSLLEVKSYGNRKIARLLGAIAYEILIAELYERKLFENFCGSIIIPIPIAKKTRRLRGFNQCELIAEGIMRADAAKTFNVRCDVLEKARETGDQVGKNRKERLEGLRDCFEVALPDAIRGKDVIVLDDIATTGATLKEAKKALKRSGARKVVLVSIAH